MSGEPNYQLVQEAKKCKYSLIPSNLSIEDVLVVWQNVSQFIIRQLLQNKAINITGLGMFSVLQRKLDLGSDRRVYVQRPIFVLSEKFAKTHAISYAKYQSPGEIPVVQLNLAVIAMEMGMDRDVVDFCIRELIGTFSRTVNSRKQAYLAFRDIGQLVVKDGKAKMKFFKDFLRTVDGSRPLMMVAPHHLLARPHTTDSFISRSSVISTGSIRPATYMLPSASNRNIWVNNRTEAECPERPPSVVSNHSGSLVLSPLGTVSEDDTQLACRTQPPAPPTRASWCSDVLAYDGGMEIQKLDKINKIQKTDLKPLVVKQDKLANEKENKTIDDEPSNTAKFSEEPTKRSPPSPDLTSACKHNSSGQELCYLCHQRQRRNVPITFTEEKEKAEAELDRVLQQYQQFKDDQFYEQERRYVSREKEQCKDVADCNVTLAEKVRQDKLPDKAFHQSYIFARRPAVPKRYLTHEEYSGLLDEQVRIRTERQHKDQTETERREREEQQYLADELAKAKQRFIESKAAATKQYQTALYSQLQNKPFRFPPAVPDSEGPIFGKVDVTPERVKEMRKRAMEVMNHQLKAMEDKKNVLDKEKQDGVRYEVEMLSRAKTEVREDCYKKYLLRKNIREDLEKSWSTQHQLKKSRDVDDLKHRKKSGLQLLDQCDKYKRCDQCKRCCDNVGASNVWKESRYIAGSRLIV